jgi:hypothetical protein
MTGATKKFMLGLACCVAVAAGCVVPTSARDGAAARPLVLAQAGADDTLRAAASSDAPIPVPENAEDIEFDSDDGKLEFNSAASVKAVAAFYRSTMKAAGWREQGTVINRANMVVLNFSKSGADLAFTIMQMGGQTNVSVIGTGLNAAAKPITPEAAEVAAQKIEAEDSGGFPVPKEHSSTGTEKTPFRTALTASVPIALPTVLAFYRRELGKRGWKEATPQAAAAPDQATVSFTSPDGPAVLKLGRENGETSINLNVKNRAEAEKAGLLPKPGQAKIMFGNILNSAATVTINKQSVNIAAGVGAKEPNGPMLELAPGKYPYSSRAAGKAGKTETVEIGADEVWGMIVGPGGVLALQLY